jgi:hypothetical protein
MDYRRAIHELREEKKKLDAAIATIETLLSDTSSEKHTSRRGRKSMSEEERKTVSERMRRYWAKRRKEA